MFSIQQEDPPEDSLLRTYRGAVHPERWGKYGDCFTVIVDRPVSLAEFVLAFYTSPVFRLERLLLHLLVSAPSNDAAALALAEGSASSFAVWYAGARTATQLLMCDRYERTRSWFRVVPMSGGKTALKFGSAVAAVRDSGSARASLGTRFRLLLGFHVLYSKVLLLAAKARVLKNARNGLTGNRS